MLIDFDSDTPFRSREVREVRLRRRCSIPRGRFDHFRSIFGILDLFATHKVAFADQTVKLSFVQTTDAETFGFL